VIFAAFAVFIWWRLVRDEWEKEHGVVRGPGRRTDEEAPVRTAVD
jgi:hypothetical protein